MAEFVFHELLGDSSADQLDMDRFSAIVEDYLLSDNNGNNQQNEEEDVEDEQINRQRHETSSTRKYDKNIISSTKLFWIKLAK